MAIVGGGRTPKLPTNNLVIWDDYLQKSIGEMTYKTRVLAVKLRFDK